MHNNDGFYLMAEVRPGFPLEIIIYLDSKWVSMSNLLEGGRKGFHVTSSVYRREMGIGQSFWLVLGEEEEGCISSGEYMWWLIFCAMHFGAYPQKQ